MLLIQLLLDHGQMMPQMFADVIAKKTNSSQFEGEKIQFRKRKKYCKSFKIILLNQFLHEKITKKGTDQKNPDRKNLDKKCTKISSQN